MSIEKPWEKPYDELLATLSSQWGGDVQKLDKRDVMGAYVYPTYKVELEGFKLELVVSEFPLPGKFGFEAEDNLEYLRIYIATRSNMECLFRHETILDRIKQKIGLTSDFQTGNESFDRKYNICGKPGKDMSWLIDRQNQEVIESLEPFIVLRIVEHGIQWAGAITNKTQLTVVEVEKVTTNIVRLAKLLGRLS